MGATQPGTSCGCCATRRRLSGPRRRVRPRDHVRGAAVRGLPVAVHPAARVTAERHEPGERDPPRWVEKRAEAVESGTRALNQLRDGVVTGIEQLGTGFLRAPANAELREALASGALTLEDLRQALLRGVTGCCSFSSRTGRRCSTHPPVDPGTVCRVLHDEAPPVGRAYTADGTPTCGDRCLSSSTDSVASGSPRDRPGRPGWLFEPFGWESADGKGFDLLSSLELSNESLLSVVGPVNGARTRHRSAAPRRLPAPRRGGSWAAFMSRCWSTCRASIRRNAPSGWSSWLATSARRPARAAPPTSLIDVLLDSALDPVLTRLCRPDPREALLRVTVCDRPRLRALLVAAARPIAKRVAALRHRRPVPPPTGSSPRWPVIARSLYGWTSTRAAELAQSASGSKLQPGKPLAFLDAHIKVGNALLGATPAVLPTASRMRRSSRSRVTTRSLWPILRSATCRAR